VADVQDHLRIMGQCGKRGWWAGGRACLRCGRTGRTGRGGGPAQSRAKLGSVCDSTWGW